MSAVTWSHLAGDTRVFALELAFHSDTESQHVTVEERASWGSFALHVQGRNLCTQVYEGETLQRVHWYLAPLLEWFVDAWDALFHEERLPDPVTVATAAEFDRHARARELSDDPESWEQLERWQAWAGRHHLGTASEGGVLPDSSFVGCAACWRCLLVRRSLRACRRTSSSFTAASRVRCP